MKAQINPYIVYLFENPRTRTLQSDFGDLQTKPNNTYHDIPYLFENARLRTMQLIWVISAADLHDLQMTSNEGNPNNTNLALHDIPF